MSWILLFQTPARPSSTTTEDARGGGFNKVGLLGRAPAFSSTQQQEGQTLLGLEKGGQQHPNPNAPKQGRVDTRNHGEDDVFGEPLALSLQPAGFRTTLTRRLRRPVGTSRRRAGTGRRGRVGGKVPGGDPGNGLKDGTPSGENNEPTELGKERPQHLLDHHHHPSLSSSEVIESTRPDSRDMSPSKSTPRSKAARKRNGPDAEDEIEVDDNDKKKRGSAIGSANQPSVSQSGRCPETTVTAPPAPDNTASVPTGSPLLKTPAETISRVNKGPSLLVEEEEKKNKEIIKRPAGGGEAQIRFAESEGAGGLAGGENRWKKTLFADKSVSDDQVCFFPDTG